MTDLPSEDEYSSLSATPPLVINSSPSHDKTDQKDDLIQNKYEQHQQYWYQKYTIEQEVHRQEDWDRNYGSKDDSIQEGFFDEHQEELSEHYEQPVSEPKHDESTEFQDNDINIMSSSPESNVPNNSEANEKNIKVDSPRLQSKDLSDYVDVAQSMCGLKNVNGTQLVDGLMKMSEHDVRKIHHTYMMNLLQEKSIEESRKKQTLNQNQKVVQQQNLQQNQQIYREQEIHQKQKVNQDQDLLHKKQDSYQQQRMQDSHQDQQVHQNKNQYQNMYLNQNQQMHQTQKLHQQQEMDQYRQIHQEQVMHHNPDIYQNQMLHQHAVPLPEERLLHHRDQNVYQAQHQQMLLDQKYTQHSENLLHKQNLYQQHQMHLRNVFHPHQDQRYYQHYQGQKFYPPHRSQMLYHPYQYQPRPDNAFMNEMIPNQELMKDVYFRQKFFENQQLPLMNGRWPPTSTAMAVEEMPLKEQIQPKSYYCSVCEQYYLEYALTQHFKSSTHRARVEFSGRPDPADLPIHEHYRGTTSNTEHPIISKELKTPSVLHRYPLMASNGNTTTPHAHPKELKPFKQQIENMTPNLALRNQINEETRGKSLTGLSQTNTYVIPKQNGESLHTIYEKREERLPNHISPYGQQNFKSNYSTANPYVVQNLAMNQTNGECSNDYNKNAFPPAKSSIQILSNVAINQSNRTSSNVENIYSEVAVSDKRNGANYFPQISKNSTKPPNDMYKSSEINFESVPIYNARNFQVLQNLPTSNPNGIYNNSEFIPERNTPSVRYTQNPREFQNLPKKHSYVMDKTSEGKSNEINVHDFNAENSQVLKNIPRSQSNVTVQSPVADSGRGHVSIYNAENPQAFQNLPNKYSNQTFAQNPQDLSTKRSNVVDTSSEVESKKMNMHNLNTKNLQLPRNQSNVTVQSFDADSGRYAPKYYVENPEILQKLPKKQSSVTDNASEVKFKERRRMPSRNPENPQMLQNMSMNQSSTNEQPSKAECEGSVPSFSAQNFTKIQTTAINYSVVDSGRRHVPNYNTTKLTKNQTKVEKSVKKYGSGSNAEKKNFVERTAEVASERRRTPTYNAEIPRENQNVSTNQSRDMDQSGRSVTNFSAENHNAFQNITKKQPSIVEQSCEVDSERKSVPGHPPVIPYVVKNLTMKQSSEVCASNYESQNPCMVQNMTKSVKEVDSQRKSVPQSNGINQVSAMYVSEQKDASQYFSTKEVISNVTFKIVPRNSSSENSESGQISPSLFETAKYKCLECKEAFKSLSDLQQHNTLRHCKILRKCKICGKFFSQVNLYNDHCAIEHSEEMKLKCNLCPERFILETDLTRHVLNHSGEVPFACLLCKKGFARKEHMVNHFKTLHKGIGN